MFFASTRRRPAIGFGAGFLCALETLISDRTKSPSLQEIIFSQ
jgi:hypothetical protein